MTLENYFALSISLLAAAASVWAVIEARKARHQNLRVQAKSIAAAVHIGFERQKGQLAAVRQRFQVLEAKTGEKEVAASGIKDLDEAEIMLTKTRKDLDAEIDNISSAKPDELEEIIFRLEALTHVVTAIDKKCLERITAVDRILVEKLDDPTYIIG
ncbi:hypothetical protein [Tateyamaria pelophila]|uniref:hypothetical protein n=1 Tax=Tateyamaria pelophila TaxID=328415 RepID=UPI001CBE571D|nr:hypothetical protein [Tateyamaria pelophila]